MALTVSRPVSSGEPYSQALKATIGAAAHVPYLCRIRGNKTKRARIVGPKPLMNRHILVGGAGFEPATPAV